MKNGLFLGAVALAALSSCGPPVNNTPVAGIPAITSLTALMDVQATAADPQFGKRDQTSFTDAEFAALADTGAKIDATSKRLKEFTKGPEWDAMGAKLNEHANALSKAAQAKDAAGAGAALSGMKTVCKDCHSKFR
jgi:hypothetical protein